MYLLFFWRYRNFKYKLLEIEEILREIFSNTNIKVIVCLNNIEYLKIEDRDRIFDMYHSSTIGGHSGVNRTYNRLKEKYF